MVSTIITLVITFLPYKPHNLSYPIGLLPKGLRPNRITTIISEGHKSSAHIRLTAKSGLGKPKFSKTCTVICWEHKAAQLCSPLKPDKPEIAERKRTFLGYGR